MAAENPQEIPSSMKALARLVSEPDMKDLAFLTYTAIFTYPLMDAIARELSVNRGSVNYTFSARRYLIRFAERRGSNPGLLIGLCEPISREIAGIIIPATMEMRRGMLAEDIESGVLNKDEREYQRLAASLEPDKEDRHLTQAARRVQQAGLGSFIRDHVLLASTYEVTTEWVINHPQATLSPRP